jgi:uncharacterized protein (DUF488 family)
MAARSFRGCSVNDAERGPGPVDLSRNGSLEIWTVGHSNIELDQLLQLLQEAQISAVADVRSDPDKVYREHFEQAPLRSALDRAGIAYVFLGRELGGRPGDRRHFDAEGHARYDLMAQTPAFRTGVARVVKGATQLRVALLCSEENPAECHRRLLVGRALIDQYDVRLLHLRAGGSVLTEAELAEQEGGQAGLFDDLEVRPWRSARSVPPSGAPSPSSSH